MQGELLDIVNDSLRREIIAVVSVTEKVSKETLLETVCDNEKEKIHCHHSHLPKMDDYDIINWNQKTSMVREGERMDAAVEMVDETELWS